MHGIFRRAETVRGLPTNPAVEVEKPRRHAAATFGSSLPPKEVRALARAADHNEQDGAIF
jgi:hypothetical protein